jgi:hypothetical protein
MTGQVLLLVCRFGVAEGSVMMLLPENMNCKNSYWGLVGGRKVRRSCLRRSCLRVEMA